MTPATRPVIRPVPRRRPIILTILVADALDAAEYREHLAACAAVLVAKLAVEAFPVSEAPVDFQPSQTRSVDGPVALLRDRASFAVNRDCKITEVLQTEASLAAHFVKEVASPARWKQKPFCWR